MADMAVELLGLARFTATLDSAADELVDLEQLNQTAGDRVVGFADVPVVTGALRDTVRAEADAVGFALLAGSPAVDYAGAVHARDPFLTTALDQHTDDLSDLYLEHADRALDHVTGA